MKNDILLDILREDAERVNSNIDLDKLDSKNILITGATGLVGLNIISALHCYQDSSKHRKFSITALSYTEPNGSMKEIFDSFGINCLYGDLSNSSFIDSLECFDCIIHSAGYGQPGKFLDDKLKTMAINTSATISLSKKLTHGGRFLFLSSSEIYSGCANKKHNEDDIGTTSPSYPRSIYIEGKRSGEAVVNSLRGMGYRAVSARLALAYGPGVRPGDSRAMNQFIQKGIKGEIDLLDSGSAIRTYGYISDIVTMLLNILIKSDKSEYNVGGKSVTSIKDLATKIGECLNSKVTIPQDEASLSGAPNIVELDLSRIEEEFGIVNYVSLDEGIKKTIDWIKNYE